MKKIVFSVLLTILSLSSFHCSAKETLAEATKGKFLMGVAINQQQVNGVNPIQTEQISHEFSAIVPENCMKPGPIHPEENKFYWDEADKFVAFGENNKQAVTGH